jgi:hypothetical protein
MSVITVSFSLLIQGGCASSLERSSEIQNQQLAVNVSSKADVVKTIGLPRTVQKDEAKGLEVWLYTGKPISSSYFVPMPIAGARSGLDATNIGPSDVPSGADVVLTLVFNRDGQLVEIRNTSK